MGWLVGVVSGWSLLRQPHYRRQAHPVLAFLFTLLLALGCAAVASVFSVIQWRNRPLSLHVITVSNHSLANALPSAGYVCDCGVPAYLQGVKSVQDGAAASAPLAHCYRQDALHTVTVVQFSNNSVPAGRLAPDGFPLPLQRPTFKTFPNGFSVTQRPVPLHLWTGDPYGILTSRIFTAPLLEGNGLLRLPLQDVVEALYFDFPRGYLRMEIRYWCINCSHCGLETLLDLPEFQGMDVRSWAACDGWGAGGSYCALERDPANPAGNYSGRCYMYPTYDAPMAARLKKFLVAFAAMVPKYMDFVTGTSDDAGEFVDLYLYLLYVNVSHVTAGVNTTYGFVEVDKGSSTWLKLLEQFPGMSQDCRENATVEVCNGTSFCNAFKTSADLGSSSIGLACTDFRHENDTCMRLATNSSNLYWNDTLCPRVFTCRDVPQASVVYTLENVTFDNKLMAERMNQTFHSMYAGAVCSNTYENVVRLGDQLLATECTDTGLCHLTGLFHNLNDPSWEEPRSSADIINYTAPLYTCYAARRQKLLSWAIITAGVLFGWFSSVLFGVRCMFSAASFLLQKTMREKSTATDAESESRHNHAELASRLRALAEQPVFSSPSSSRYFRHLSLPPMRR